MSGKISRAHYNDRVTAKREAKQSTQVKVSYITKAGKPSKIKADWRFFNTTEEAQAYCDKMNSNSSRISYEIVDNWG